MENREHTLICVLGRTASGKDSLVNKVCERTGFNQLISYTTRERRENEGDTHIFISEEDFEAMSKEGQIAAFTQIGEYKYFCTFDQLYEADFYIIDPAGLDFLKSLEIPNLKIVSVYIHIPDDIREKRALELRKDDRAKFRARNFNEREQFRNFEKNVDYDYSIKNIDLPKAYSVLRWICDVEGVFKNHMEDKTDDDRM